MVKFLYRLDRKTRANFTFWDLSLLKAYGAIPGLILGAYFPAFILENMWWLLLIFFILFVRYMYLLFIKKNINSTL